MYEINEQQIRKWWGLFKNDGELVEIRLLGKAAYSGYFTNIDTLIKQLKPYLDTNNAVYYGNIQAYFTLNVINSALYSREQRDVFVKKPKSTTTDGDIVRRKFVLIDLDPNRAAGISANNEEFEKAHLKCVEIYRYLISQGFKEPIITRSGNGWHAYLTCDMPNDEEHNDIIKRFLQALSKMFSDENVEIDEKVFNPARIDKLVGTWAKKGADSVERPWRIADIVKVPNDLSPNDDSLFEAVANLIPKEEHKQLPQRSYNQYNNTPFNLSSWLVEHGIKFRESRHGGSTKYELEYCPWVDTHSDRKKWDSALFVDSQGKITFNCTHSHCSGKTWQEVRLFYEPTAYDKPKYEPRQYRYTPPQPKYEIKGEIPELGKKWLTMSSIKKLNLSEIDGIKTGFDLLDKAINKLHFGEVTLLSGSNASGKSSWLNTLLMNIANQNTSVALWSGELPEQILKTWLQMVAAGKDNLRLSSYGDGKYYVPNNIGELIDNWLEDKLLIYNTEYGNQWEQLFSDMTELANVGVKVFVLDNLMAMNIDLLSGDKNEKQRQVILDLKKFAKTKDVHLILVAHPRKSMAFLRKTDISGTSDLTNAVDNVFIIHRVNNDFFRTGAEFFGQSEIQRFQGYGNVIEVAKNRMYGVVDTMIGLHYEIESRRFKNSESENIEYGWKHKSVQTYIQYSDDNLENEAIPDGMPFGETIDEAPF